MSVYGFDSEGVAERQLELMSAVGAHVSMGGLACVVGGDFNAEPGAARGLGIWEEGQGELICTDSPRAILQPAVSSRLLLSV